MEEPKRYSAYANERSDSNIFLCCFGKSQKYSTKQVETKNDLKKSKEALNRNGKTNDESNTDSMLTNNSLQFVNYSSLQFIDNIEKDDGYHGKHECDKCGDNCECDNKHDNHTNCHQNNTDQSIVIVDDVQQPIETIDRNQSDSRNDRTDHKNHSDNQQLIVAVKNDQTQNTVIQSDYSNNAVVDHKHNQHTSNSHDAAHHTTTSSYNASEQHHSSIYDTSHHHTSNTNTDTGYSSNTGGSHDCGGSLGDTGGTSSYD